MKRRLPWLKPGNKDSGITDYVPRKLTRDIVRQIREWHANGISQWEIVRMLAKEGINVTQAAISRVVNRKRWANTP